MEKTISSLAVALLLVMSAVAPAVSATPTEEKPITTQEEAVEFTERVLEMNGHLNASIQNAEAGQMDQARLQAAHPGDEGWSVIGPALAEANATFADQLEAELDALPENAESMSPAEYRAHVTTTVSPMLDRAIDTAVSAEVREDVGFDGEVTMLLLDRTAAEYNTAVDSTNTVVNQEEYWDARGYAAVLETYYDAEIRPTLSAEDAREIGTFVDTVQRKIASEATPSELEPVFEETGHEIAEYTGAGAEISEREEAVTFVRQIEEMKGHLASSTQWAEQGDLERAKTHVRHPVEEYWDLVGPTLTEADSDLAQRLNATLTTLPEKTASMNASEYRSYIEGDVYSMLDEGTETVVADDIREDVAFQGDVLNALLSRAADEYAAGVTENGTVTESAEYWDAYGFVVRADARFAEKIKPELSTESGDEIAEFMETIERKIDERASPSAVSDTISHTRAEVSEYTGAAVAETETGHEDGHEETIDHINQSLDQVVDLYSQDKPTEAKQLLTETYLTQFEGLEGPLIEQRPELVEQLEADFNEKLPNRIDDGAPVSDVESTVESMQEKLGTAKHALASQDDATVRIENETTANASVPNSSANTTDGDSTGATGPGFVAIGALLALVAVTLLAVRMER